MKNPIRRQSQLLIRRSYKPARVPRYRLNVTFQPTRPVEVSIGKGKINPPANAASVEIALSG